MPHEFPADATKDLPQAYGGAPLQGRLKKTPEDFQVTEVLGYMPSGEGEHAFLTIQKRELNTQDIVKRLAQFAKVKPMSIGFAGLKDKQAVTTQHFSVHLPGQSDPDWSQLNDTQFRILDAQRHHRKIRRGVLKGNDFKLVLRDIQGDVGQADTTLTTLKKHGFPNYFGNQRFGWESSNLKRADQWFNEQLRKPKPEQKRMLLSAARSYLFNAILAERVENTTWRTALNGDVMLLDRTNKQFLASPLDEETIQRTKDLATHPSGLLFGKPGRALRPIENAFKIENQTLLKYAPPNWLPAIEQQNVDEDRRALGVSIHNLSWNWLDQQSLELKFNLPAGAYATMLIRELMHLKDE